MMTGSRKWRYPFDPYQARRVPVRTWKDPGFEHEPMRQRTPPEHEPSEPEPTSSPSPSSSGVDVSVASTPPAEDQREELAQLRREKEALQATLDTERASREEAEREAREAKVRAQLATDELERAKQRVAREAKKEIAANRRSVVTAFLDVLDDLDRAMDATQEDARDPALRRGVELVRKRFLDTLGRFGVQHMPSMDTPFDPARHDAVSMVPVSEPERDGVVVGVVREGYTIGDEVLRPASVAVGKYRV